MSRVEHLYIGAMIRIMTRPHTVEQYLRLSHWGLKRWGTTVEKHLYLRALQIQNGPFAYPHEEPTTMTARLADSEYIPICLDCGDYVTLCRCRHEEPDPAEMRLVLTERQREVLWEAIALYGQAREDYGACTDEDAINRWTAVLDARDGVVRMIGAE